MPSFTVNANFEMMFSIYGYEISYDTYVRDKLLLEKEIQGLIIINVSNVF